MVTPLSPPRPGPVQTRLEVADVLRVHGPAYRRAHPLSAQQAAVVRHLTQCRTAALGGHIDACDGCGFTRISYNSCRDRHCPKCQATQREQWVQTRLQRLLPVPHFHVVFTLPDELNPLMLRNPAALYDLLFRAASRALLQLARDPQRLGAQIGFTAVLHTWGQNVLFHPHLHCVVTGGGLAPPQAPPPEAPPPEAPPPEAPQGERWVASRQDYLLPVKVIGRLFRGKFLDGLQRLYDAGDLSFSGSTADLADPASFAQLRDRLYRKDWVVYAKPPFGGAAQVFRYLGRYSHRVAITNRRLLSMDDRHVTFRYKDYADGQRWKTMRLTADEFIRRFLLHVLPKRFVRIRHYGLMAGRNVDGKLARARRLLTADPNHGASQDDARPDRDARPDDAKAWKDPQPQRCPRCQGPLTRRPLLRSTVFAPRGRPVAAGLHPGPHQPNRLDSS